jgi:multiple sugar transport system permease protein
MKKTEKMLIKFIQYFLLILLSVICIIPFYIMIINSTRTNAQISVAVSFLPGTNLIQNIKSLNKTISMMVSLKNSILISLPSTLLSGYFGTMAACNSLSRFPCYRRAANLDSAYHTGDCLLRRTGL